MGTVSLSVGALSRKAGVQGPKSGEEVQKGSELLVSGTGAAGPLGLSRCPCWAPFDGVHVPRPRPDPRPDLCTGSSCSWLSFPASQSHGNSCSCPAPYSSPPAWPCSTQCPSTRAGSHSKEESRGKQTPPRPPHQRLMSLTTPLSSHGQEHLQGPLAGHSQCPPRCVAAPGEAPLKPMAGNMPGGP